MKALTVPEVASRLGITDPDVTELIKKGEIIAIEMGGLGVAKTFLVTEEAVEKYKKKKETPKKSIEETPATDFEKKVGSKPKKPAIRTFEKEPVKYMTPRKGKSCEIEKNEWIWINIEIKSKGKKETRRFLKSFVSERGMQVKDIVGFFGILRTVKLNNYNIIDAFGTRVTPEMYIEYLAMQKVHGALGETKTEVNLFLEEKQNVNMPFYIT